MATKRILSIDGGGIRGIIPATVLVGLEKFTNKPTNQTFDLVAGTSTGAILAAAIATGVPATAVLEIYTEKAKGIFRKTPLTFPRRIVSGWMYRTSKLHDVIAETLPDPDMTLQDSPIDILLTAKRLDDGHPWYLVRNSPHNSGLTGDLKLARCVTASAAAPTYFQPWDILDDTTNVPKRSELEGPFVDGGVGIAGSPVYRACIEAFDYADYKESDTSVISLGTGDAPTRGRPGWILSWLTWVLGELLESTAEQQERLVSRVFPNTPFYVIDRSLPEPIGQDAVKKIPDLVRYGQELADRVNWMKVLDGSDTDFRVSGSG